MTDEVKVIDKAWSNISPGDFVRWATPRFIEYGVVISRSGNSLSFDSIERDRPVVIPDAKWYFVQGKMHGPRAEECLVILNELPKKSVPRQDAQATVYRDFMTAEDVAEYLNWDQKEVRRKIRRGVIPAHKSEGRWMISRQHLIDQAAKHGWV
jgi:excisionase family DNA binding protein